MIKAATHCTHTNIRCLGTRNMLTKKSVAVVKTITTCTRYQRHNYMHILSHRLTGPHSSPVIGIKESIHLSSQISVSDVSKPNNSSKLELISCVNRTIVSNTAHHNLIFKNLKRTARDVRIEFSIYLQWQMSLNTYHKAKIIIIGRPHRHNNSRTRQYKMITEQLSVYGGARSPRNAGGIKRHLAVFERINLSEVANTSLLI